MAIVIFYHDENPSGMVILILTLIYAICPTFLLNSRLNPYRCIWGKLQCTSFPAWKCFSTPSKSLYSSLSQHYCFIVLFYCGTHWDFVLWGYKIFLCRRTFSGWRVQWKLWTEIVENKSPPWAVDVQVQVQRQITLFIALVVMESMKSL